MGSEMCIRDRSGINTDNLKLGIRAENMSLTNEPPAGQNALPLEINRVDDYGNYKLVLGKFGGFDAKVKVERDHVVGQGPTFMTFASDKACLYVNEHLFS